MKFSRRDAFTLVELMVVVAIIGILATIAVPGYRAYQIRARMTEGKYGLSLAYVSEKSAFAEYGTYVSCMGTFGFDLMLKWDCGGFGSQYYVPYMKRDPFKAYYSTAITLDDGDATWGNTAVRNMGVLDCNGGVYDCSPSRWPHLSFGMAMAGKCGDPDLWNTMNTYNGTQVTLTANTFKVVTTGTLKPCTNNPISGQAELLSISDVWTIDHNRVLIQVHSLP